jgi:hypothetical protein
MLLLLLFCGSILSAAINLWIVKMGCVKYEICKIFLFPHLKVRIGGLCNPENYANTGIPELLNSCISKRGRVNQNRIVVTPLVSQFSFFVEECVIQLTLMQFSLVVYESFLRQYIIFFNLS